MTNRHPTRRDFVRLTAVGGAASIAGLSGLAGSGGPALAQGLQVVNIGMPQAATDVGYFVAHKRGYFKEEGLDVKFHNFASAARMVTSLASGDLQVGAGGPSAGLYNAIARGIDIRIVADKSKNQTDRGSQKLLVRKELYDSGKVRKVADLKGMRVANAAPGSSGATVLYKFLQSAKMGPKDIEEVFMSVPQMVQGLQSGAIDAALPFDPATTLAIRKGIAVSLGNDYDVYPIHQIAVTLYSGQFIKEQPKAAHGFLKAFLRGVRDHNDALDDKGMLSGPKGDEIANILAEYGSFKNPGIYKSFVIAYCDPDGRLHMESIKEDIEIFQKLGQLKDTVDLSKVVDTSILEAVLKEIGPYKKK